VSLSPTEITKIVLTGVQILKKEFYITSKTKGMESFHIWFGSLLVIGVFVWSEWFCAARYNSLSLTIHLQYKLRDGTDASTYCVSYGTEQLHLQNWQFKVQDGTVASTCCVSYGTEQLHLQYWQFKLQDGTLASTCCVSYGTEQLHLQYWQFKLQNGTVASTCCVSYGTEHLRPLVV
jgi:hypothetical protein